MLGILRNPRYAGYSIYTSKDTRRQYAGESRRKALGDNLVKDESGELVLGQWEAIVEAEQWWTVQNLLDGPAPAAPLSENISERGSIGVGNQ
ncbi:recombinase family protein [Corynebacterium durum]|uniref:recombinase family protein n=1 Tax=Corynebacterium durum TaxID=61592 RepID=UPI0028ECC251|nr:recombinase family protein [Corynebacterium durum]